MFKIGFKASHFLSSHKVGKVVDIKTEKNNQLTIGGTTSSVVWIILEYTDKKTSKVYHEKHRSGDLIRVYD